MWIFQNPRTPWFRGGINVLACSFCILSPTLQRSANFTCNCGFERSKQNPPVPHFDHFLYAHLVFQATYRNLHFLSTHWNNRRLLEPRGTSEAVFCALRFKYSNQTLCSHILQIQFYVSSVDSIKTKHSLQFIHLSPFWQTTHLQSCRLMLIGVNKWRSDEWFGSEII